MQQQEFVQTQTTLSENGVKNVIALLAEGATTVAYSYIGPSLTEAVYR
jgi:trans-2-enoyl-CoA reductase